MDKEKFLEKIGYYSFCDKVKSAGLSFTKYNKYDEVGRLVSINSGLKQKSRIIAREEGSHIKYKIVEKKCGEGYSSEPSNINNITTLCYARVVSCSKSIELFRLKTARVKMSEIIVKPWSDGKGQSEVIQLFPIEEILLNYKSKVDGRDHDIIVLKYENKLYKFDIEDIEIIYPDIDKILEAFPEPKDRELGKNSIVKVRIKNDRSEKEIIAKVNERMSLGSNNNKLYYEVIEKDTNNKYIVNNSSLKLINNDNKKEFKQIISKEKRYKRSSVFSEHRFTNSLRERANWATITIPSQEPMPDF